MRDDRDADVATTLEHGITRNARGVRRLFYEETTSLLLPIYADCRIIVGLNRCAIEGAFAADQVFLVPNEGPE